MPLNDEQKQQIVDGRIQQFEAEAYNHELNVQLLEDAVVEVDANAALSTEEKAKQKEQLQVAIGTAKEALNTINKTIKHLQKRRPK